MKIPRYYMITAPWWLVCARQKSVDTNVVLYRLGKALGIIMDEPSLRKQDWRSSKASWAKQTIR